MKNRLSIALGFIALIFVGAILLSFPCARAAGSDGSVSTAIFTACSAVCVTGLSVVDIATEFSRFGQIVILVLVEIGCLGLMTCGTFLLVAVGRRLSLSREFSLMNAYGVAQIQGLRGLICWVVGSMLAIEALGAAAIYASLGDAYESVFYSVMSFCNAGFSLRPDSIASFADRPYLVISMAVETILGGIGFMVIYNLCTYRVPWINRKRAARLSLHTRVVLKMTALLLAVAFVAFLAVEWGRSLEGFGPVQKLWVAFYQAVTPRTCGFSVIPTESLHPLTCHIYEFLMFIGGAPGSSAAGIKVTTAAVLVYTMAAMCRGERDTVIADRIVPADIVRESLVIFMAIVVFTALVMGVLLVTEQGGPIEPDALFFEAVSAITTTGLSIGSTTAKLSPEGRVVIMIAMFFGRLGALSVVMMIGDRESRRHIRYPAEELVVG